MIYLVLHYTINEAIEFFQVTEACKKHGGFYLGSIGGPAAILAQNCIKKVEVLEYPELGWYSICSLYTEYHELDLCLFVLSIQ